MLKTRLFHKAVNFEMFHFFEKTEETCKITVSLDILIVDHVLFLKTFSSLGI